MTTATPTKTSPENITSFHLYYSVIISTRSTSNRKGELPRNQTGRSGVPVEKNKMKNSPSFTHVLNKTLNLVISRCCFVQDGKEMYQNVKRTCRAIVFPHLSRRHTRRFYAPIAAISENRQVCPVQRLRFSPIAAIGV